MEKGSLMNSRVIKLVSAPTGARALEEHWRKDPRWCGVTRPYSAEKVLRLRGTLRIQQDYAYNSAGRLDRVRQGSYAAYYAYEPLSPLVGTVEYRYQTSTVRLTADRAYDHLNRLTAMVNTPQTGPVVSQGHAYNAASQRINATLVDRSFSVCRNDSLLQATNSWQHTFDGPSLRWVFTMLGSNVNKDKQHTN